jgi:thiol-disulfide isomerase/thioredoxin
MIMKKRPVFLIAVCLILIPSCRELIAQEDGKAWIERVAGTYRELKSYYFEGTVLYKMDGFGNTTKSGNFIRYGKPGENKLLYQVGLGRSQCVLACNGAATVAYSGDSLQYVKKQSTDIGALIKTLYRGEAAAYLGNGLPVDYATLDSRTGSAKILGRQKVRQPSGEFDCVVVEAEIIPDTRPPITRAIRTLWIDPRNFIVLRNTSHSQTLTPKGAVLIDVRQEMQLSSYRINEELQDPEFEYNPPPGARASESLDLSDSDAGLIVSPPTDSLALNDLDNRRTTFRELQGQVVLLDFWATWCVPCRKEMKLLESIHQRYKDKGLAVFGVDQESAQLQSDFLKKKSFSYPMLVDGNRALTKRFKADVLPTLVLIDRSGKIAYWEQGLVEEKDLERWLETMGFQ